MTAKKAYSIFLALAYLIVVTVGILHHELFIDEAHHWLLARDSDSIGALIANTRLEGHPLTWSLLLYGLSRLWIDPLAMQILQVVISFAAITVFIRKAPFSLMFKTLFVFGYFMVFEYALFSRNYMLGILFLFLACADFEHRETKFLRMMVYLTLAVNVHLMFTVIALALYLVLVFEKFQNARWQRNDFFLGSILFGLGIASIIVQISFTDSGWLLDPIAELPIADRLTQGSVSLFKGIIAIPDFRTLHFWNTNMVVNLSHTLAAVLAIIIYALPLLLFKNRKTRYFVYAALLGTQIFFFITQRAATRFHGITFLIFIVALWIGHFYKADNPQKYRGVDLTTRGLQKPVIYAILSIHFFSGVAALIQEYRYPFTAGKMAIEFLKENGLANREIVTVTCDGTILSAYLGQRIWFLCDGGYNSFCRWDNRCVGQVSPGKTSEMLKAYMSSRNSAVFISYYPVAENPDRQDWVKLGDDLGFRFLKKFDHTILDNGYLYVFELKKHSP